MIERWFAAALKAADPAAAIERVISLTGDQLRVGERRVDLRGRLLVVGVGKAAVGMAQGVDAVCGRRVETGLLITKDGHAAGRLPENWRTIEASHPIPDERGVAATRAMLELLGAAGEGDVVIALISGGGSALLEAPRPPVTLADVARVTDLLLRAGAPIQDLNAARIPLSQVKGGGLRRAAGKAAMITLILSDVLGNNPQIIASGPTVEATATGEAAIDVLERYRVMDAVPAIVIETLNRLPETASWDFPDDVFAIVADNESALNAVAIAAAADGFAPRIVWMRKGGVASELAREWVGLCQSAAQNEVLLGGGEATVTVKGEGIGGRNTEFALAAALELARRELAGWTIASLATDGQDGPTGVAGAIADMETCDRARARGVDPRAALAANDSLRVFEAAGGVVNPGPTGTNVNDLYVAVQTG